MKLFGLTLRTKRSRIADALEAPVRVRLDALKRRLHEESESRNDGALAQPIALARFAAIDCETTGPNMHKDRIISVGGVGVREGTVDPADCFEVIFRQHESSATDNILIHQIGGQQQLGGVEPALAMIEFLEFVGTSVSVAFRAEFDQTVLEREIREMIGIPLDHVFLDLAHLLPAVFPGTPNDSLDDWLTHFGLEPIGRHQAIADAWAVAQLLMIVQHKAIEAGRTRVRHLAEMEKAQRWLGKRR